MTLQLKIHINPEYEKLVPKISDQEYETFKADMKERDALPAVSIIQGEQNTYSFVAMSSVISRILKG